ncbi:MAG TPA: nitroreductase family protein [Acidimicrobiales bacterium]|jgi:nitroreductase
MNHDDPEALAAVDHVLRTTRAVRRRLDLDRPVPREVVLECLRLAVQAPTASNSQNWRWLVVTDPAKRSALAELYAASGADYLAAAAKGTTDPQTRRVYESALALTDTLHRVPVHVIPCLEGRVDGAPNLLVASAYGSIVPAAWSFMLALRSRGLGSVWTTLHLAREAEAAELLGIPNTVMQVALLPVAYTIGTDFKPAGRPPVEQITYWDTWGANDAGTPG